MKERGNNLENLNVNLTPQEAQNYLTNLGIAEDAISSLLETGDFGCHELRALARIALSGHDGNLRTMYIEERQRDFKG